jgi:DNA-binding NarL/FixJ family response regulator
MLSAMQQESVEERCYRLGAQGFVRKPFDPDIFLGLLQELLETPPEVKVEHADRRLREVPIAVTLAWRGGA